MMDEQTAYNTLAALGHQAALSGLDDRTVRLECLRLMSQRANELTARGVDISPEMIEQWTKRMVNFVVYGAFDPASDAFVSRMMETAA